MATQHKLHRGPKLITSAFRFLNIAAAKSRFARAAATTRSRSALSMPCSRWAWSPSG